MVQAGIFDILGEGFAANLLKKPGDVGLVIVECLRQARYAQIVRKVVSDILAHGLNGAGAVHMQLFIRKGKNFLCQALYIAQQSSPVLGLHGTVKRDAAG